MKLIKSASWATDFFKVSSIGPALISSSSTRGSIVSKTSELLTEALKLVVAGLLVIVTLVVAVALLVQRSCFHCLYSSNPFVEDAINPDSQQSLKEQMLDLKR